MLVLGLFSCEKPAQTNKNQTDSTKTKKVDTTAGASTSLIYPEEKHFKNLRQLTFGGDNAEAYWSFDSQKLSFQSNFKEWGVECDQIFLFDTQKEENMKGKTPKMLSTGKGRTTCSYFMPGDSTIVYASTHKTSDKCPVEPSRSGGKYVWAVYESFDIFVADLKGNIKKQLTDAKGYDAEATVSPDGKMIVYTSISSGDLELWTMNIDGTNKKQITKDLGYDGGAFFSPDSKKLVFRASRPTTPEEIKEYKELLVLGQVQPTKMEIFTCNVDGSDIKQITKLGKANWAPFFHPNGKKIIFSSNHKGKRGFEFNLYMTDLEGNNIEKISSDKVFDSFPMFSPDGKKLIFSSNRNNGGTRNTNLFLAEWAD